MLYNTPMTPFNVKWESGIPVYEQVIYAVKKAIVSGQLLPGDRFPSVRTLSRELRINPNTVQKVITSLVNEKLLEVQPGIGTIVSVTREATDEQRTRILDKEIEHLVVEAKRLSLSEDEVIGAVKTYWKKLSKEK